MIHEEHLKRIVLHSDPDCDPEEDVLEFRLTYEGLLLESGNNSKHGKHKHEIRKKFHPQLQSLWKNTPCLNDMTFPLSHSWAFGELQRSKMVEHLANNFQQGKYRFVPLVTEQLSLWCGIDILFLRQGRPGMILKSGDIDNRIKTIFDALKMPTQKEDLGGYSEPDADEDPFFCLLQDDKLVAKVTVEADTLLEPLTGGIPNLNDARLIITVRVRPVTISVANIGFAG